MTTKQDLHHMVDDLPQSVVEVAARFLDQLRRDEEAGLPPVLRDAPWDNEPVDPDEEEGTREALADMKAGRVISNDELRRELGW